jgi:hypothetical protein
MFHSSIETLISVDLPVQQQFSQLFVSAQSGIFFHVHFVCALLPKEKWAPLY